MTGLLRDDLGFDGLLFTDALTMRAITEAYGIGEASVRALEAGADVLLSPKDVSTAIDAVLAAIESGRLTRFNIEESVRRILEMKAKLGLHLGRTVSLMRWTRCRLRSPSCVRRLSRCSLDHPCEDNQGLIPLNPDGPGLTVHIRYAPSSWLWANRSFSGGLLGRMPDVTQVLLDERSSPEAYAAARIYFPTLTNSL
ncbi:MAG: hypothetical protein CM1200mP14_23410 [Gammaproteobacteria bacterium]|nr:MAG: hypothetical protein CM1200mP14_23410 [Gammaproteobacteria bacterium]